MAKFFRLTGDDRELGFYAGFFMTALMAGAGVSAIFWGVISDRYGRKRVILFGLFAIVLPQILFGVSTSLWLALTCRLSMGLLNGGIGAAKALAPDLVPPSEQASIMSIIAATWGLGNVIGPALGGALSQYDLCEADPSQCPKFPFLQPNLVCAAAAAVGFAAVYIFLPDDGRALRAKKSNPEEHDQAVLRAGTSTSDRDATNATAATPSVRRPMTMVAFYGFVALTDIIVMEIFPLLCYAPRDSGGLAIDTQSVGYVLSVGGFALVFFQLFIFPPISRRIPLHRLCLISCTLCAPIYALQPFVTLFSDDSLMLAALMLQTSLLRFATGTTFTCTFALLNNCVPSDARGRMQGIAMTVGSIARGVGPTLGAELFAWSLTNNLPFPFDVHFAYLVVTCLALAPALIAFATFSSELDHPVEADKPEGNGSASANLPRNTELETATEKCASIARQPTNDKRIEVSSA